MNVYIKTSLQHGRGVFAARRITAGEVILEFSGAVLSRAQVREDDYHLQIDEDRYLGASGEADDYVNHSCEPNAGFAGSLRLVALRDIEADQEITWDYSCAIDEADFPGFPCRCGSIQCRGRVQSFRHLDAATQQRLKSWVLPYLRRKYFPADAT